MSDKRPSKQIRAEARKRVRDRAKTPKRKIATIAHHSPLAVHPGYAAAILAASHREEN